MNVLERTMKMDKIFRIQINTAELLINKSTLNSKSFMDFCRAKYDEECQIASSLDQKAGVISALFLAGITLFISEYAFISCEMLSLAKMFGKCFVGITYRTP